MPKRKQLWRKSVGEKGATVRVFERTPGGVLYIAAWDPTLGRAGGMRKESLKHNDKDRALAHALEQSAKLQRGQEEIRSGKVTLARVFTLYQEHRTPRKSRTEQKADIRRIEMWSRFLGGAKLPERITKGEWERFVDLRSSGAIDARGNAVAETDGEGNPRRRSVRTRTVEADLQWLSYVLGWAADWKVPQGHYLLSGNPVRGYEIPSEKNPNRPVASQDRFEAVRKVAHKVKWEMRRKGKKPISGPSYLPELLDIVNGTGRRISAVCKLTYADLRLEKTEARPYGAIRWPSQTDKTGRETLVPIGPIVRAALDRVLEARPGIRKAPLFPAPGDATKPITRYLADKWLRRAEEIAEIPPQKGSLWHAYRRKWATERKHLPDADVMETGGWKSLDALKSAYQQADERTMLQVVLGAGELREVQK